MLVLTLLLRNSGSIQSLRATWTASASLP